MTLSKDPSRRETETGDLGIETEAVNMVYFGSFNLEFKWTQLFMKVQFYLKSYTNRMTRPKDEKPN